MTGLIVGGKKKRYLFCLILVVYLGHGGGFVRWIAVLFFSKSVFLGVRGLKLPN